MSNGEVMLSEFEFEDSAAVLDELPPPQAVKLSPKTKPVTLLQAKQIVCKLRSGLK
jgi:hypothetical protein